MDNIFIEEVERAFRAGTWYQAESQNEIDIDCWLCSGEITEAEAERLRKLNQELVKEYI